MALTTVAIISPGDMGHAVGRMLGLHGYEVITCLANRSERTKRLATEGGIRDYPTMAEMLERADIVLSIVPPGLAFKAADEVAKSMSTSGFCPHTPTVTLYRRKRQKLSQSEFQMPERILSMAEYWVPRRMRHATTRGSTSAASGRSC